jgi:predicted glutamine amidotransferase
MCRLLGFSAREAISLEPYIAQLRRLSQHGQSLEPPTANGHGDGQASHPDGWGLVCADRRGILISPPFKSDRPAFADPELHQLDSVRSALCLAHVRRASTGLKVTLEQAHPFEHGGIVLAHNGTFAGELFKSAQQYQISDSELFLLELAKHWQPRTVGALADVLCALLEDEDVVGRFTAANLLIAEGRRLFALRWCHRDENYYTLYVRQSPDRVEIASEPCEGGDWQLLKNSELIAIQDGDLAERLVLSSS